MKLKKQSVILAGVRLIIILIIVGLVTEVTMKGLINNDMVRQLISSFLSGLIFVYIQIKYFT